MSKKSDGLLADERAERWSFTDLKTNSAFTTNFIGDTQSAKDTRHLDFLQVLVLNKTAIHHTVTASLRDASSGGTVLAQFPLLVGASQTAQVSPADIHVTATQGKGFYVTVDTVAPSVTAAVNAAGWTDQSTDY